MSISRFQEKFLRPGCLTFVGVVMAAVFVISILGRLGGPGGDHAPTTASTVATVAGNPVDSATVNQAIQQMDAQFAQFGGSLPADQRIAMTAGAVGQVLQQAALLALADQHKVKLDDASLVQYWEAGFKDAVTGARAQMVGQNKMKADATDAEFEALVKKETGKTIAEIKAESRKQLDEALKDPAKRAQIAAGFAQSALVNQIATGITISDQELKAQFDTLTVKRILVGSQTNDAIVALGNRIVDEIKGGLKFEAAMDKYSKDLPQPQKRVSENVTSVTGQQLEDEDFKPLQTMKPGETSGAIRTREGIVIYHLVDRKSNLPPDFEKQKETMRTAMAKQRATAQVNEQLTAMVESDAVKWLNPSFHVLYQFSKIANAPGADRDTKLQALAVDARKALDGATGEDRQVAAKAFFGVVTALWNSPTANKDTLRKDRVDAIDAFLETNEDPKLRLELVELHLAAKDNSAAAEALLKAAQYNTDYSAAGQAVYSDLQSKFNELREKGILSKEVETQINAEQARWREEKIAADKAAAAQKARDEEERKKQEAADKAAQSLKGASPAPKTGN